MKNKQLISPQWKYQLDNDNIYEISIQTKTQYSTEEVLVFKFNICDIIDDKELFNEFRRVLTILSTIQNDSFLQILHFSEYENSLGYYFEFICSMPQMKTTYQYFQENCCLQVEIASSIKNICEIYKSIVAINCDVYLSLEDISLVHMCSSSLPFPQIAITPFAFFKALIDKAEERKTYQHKSFVSLFEFFEKKIINESTFNSKSNQQENKKLSKDYFLFPNKSKQKEQTDIFHQIIERLKLNENTIELINKNKYIQSITNQFKLKAFDLDSIQKESEIGKGFSSTVFKVSFRNNTFANDNSIKLNDEKIIKQSFYALKQTNSSFIDLLHKEAFVLSQLHHPNVIEYKGFLNERNTQNGYLLLEYSQYGDLHEYIKNQLQSNEPIPISTIKILVGQLFASLFYIHDQRIVHRDIKPMNYLIKQLQPFIWIQLCDFGNSRTNDTIMKSKVGTLITSSPDIMNENGYTNRIELFSLACCIYYILFGIYPSNECQRMNDVVMKIEHKMIDYNFKERFYQWIEQNQPSNEIIEEYMKLVSLVQQMIEMTTSKLNENIWNEEDYWNHFKSTAIVIDCLKDVNKVFEKQFPFGL